MGCNVNDFCFKAFVSIDAFLWDAVFFLYGYKIESFGRLLVFSRVTMEDRDKPPIEIGGSWYIIGVSFP